MDLLCLYRGRTLKDMRIISIATDPAVVFEFAGVVVQPGKAGGIGRSECNRLGIESRVMQVPGGALQALERNTVAPDGAPHQVTVRFAAGCVGEEMSGRLAIGQLTDDAAIARTVTNPIEHGARR